jgi:hypothetical protein
MCIFRRATLKSQSGKSLLGFVSENGVAGVLPGSHQIGELESERVNPQAAPRLKGLRRGTQGDSASKCPNRHFLIRVDHDLKAANFFLIRLKNPTLGTVPEEKTRVNGWDCAEWHNS